MPEPFTGPKIFTVQQANRLLPQVRELLKTLRAIQRALHALEDTVAITELEGLQADGTPTQQARAKASPHSEQLSEGVGHFQDTLNQLDSLGCQLKDLDDGLVDFFTVHQGQLVYLCWKDGETAIRFWHHLEDGFADRRPITELANN